MLPLRAAGGGVLGCLSPDSAGCSQALVSLACRCPSSLCFHCHVTSSCIAAYISLVALLRGALATGLQTTQIRYDQIAVNYVCGRFSNECTLWQAVDVSLGMILFDPLLMLRLTADELEDCGSISSASNVREGGYMLRTPCRCAPSG